jgi:hypothetical protein
MRGSGWIRNQIDRMTTAAETRPTIADGTHAEPGFFRLSDGGDDGGGTDPGPLNGLACFVGVKSAVFSTGHDLAGLKHAIDGVSIDQLAGANFSS